MIASFADAGTEDIFNREDTKTARATCPQSLWVVAQRKLDQLNAAEALQDLAAPPGNRLEALKGDRKGQHSIRVNQQHRVCFRWTERGAEGVAIVDYHGGGKGSKGGDMVRIPTGGSPTHPGEMLAEEFLGPLGMSQTELAARIRVPFQRVNRIINQKQAVSPDTALRLGRLFDTTPAFWLNLQLAWDLRLAMESKEAARIERIRPLRAKRTAPA